MQRQHAQTGRDAQSACRSSHTPVDWSWSGIRGTRLAQEAERRRGLDAIARSYAPLHPAVYASGGALPPGALLPVADHGRDVPHRWTLEGHGAACRSWPKNLESAGGSAP